MTGPLFDFNGYFIYGIQLMTLLSLAALILDGMKLNVRPSIAAALCVLVPMSMFASKPEFTNTETGDPATSRLIASLPANVGEVHFTFAPEDWLTIVGVASRMKHEHRSFCVDDVWSFAFGKDNRCRQVDGLTNLVLTHEPRKCEAPCKVLSKDDRFEFQEVPYPAFRLPFTITPDDIGSLNKGFHGSVQDPMWSSRALSRCLRKLLITRNL